MEEAAAKEELRKLGIYPDLRKVCSVLRRLDNKETPYSIYKPRSGTPIAAKSTIKKYQERITDGPLKDFLLKSEDRDESSLLQAGASSATVVPQSDRQLLDYLLERMWIPDPEGLALDPLIDYPGFQCEEVAGRELCWDQGTKGQVERCWFTEEEDKALRRIGLALAQGGTSGDLMRMYHELQELMCRYFEKAVQHDFHISEGDHNWTLGDAQVAMRRAALNTKDPDFAVALDLLREPGVLRGKLAGFKSQMRLALATTGRE